MDNNSILPEIIENVDDIVIDDELMPEPEPKLKVKKEDVFKDQGDSNGEEVPPAVLSVETPMLKKPKRTRKMTQENLDKLAIAREKAHAKRKENAQLRREGKLKTKKEEKEEKIKQDIEDKRPVVNNIVNETKNITNNITEEDIKRIALETSKKATQSALDGYEQVRKQRKEAKKKEKEKQNEKVKVQQTIIRASGKKYGSEGFFNDCF